VAENSERKLRTMDDIPLDGRTVLLRCDFNVAVGDDGVVDETEDYRIEAALPTIEELLQRRCKVLVITHYGRPSEDQSESFGLASIHRRLEELLRDDVKMLGELTGDTVKATMAGMARGSVAMLPNVRLDVRETSRSEKFGREMAELGDVYVNEAFSVCHRDHTSVSVIPTFLDSCAGRRTAEEYRVLLELSENPSRPYVAIVSGAKVHTKVNLLRKLISQVDTMCVGGVLANMFLANQGKAPRGSFTYEDIPIGPFHIMVLAPAQ